ncbi:hypothetical protein OB69_06415 [Roseivirga seohaensis subsp. aquiponti]|uniref:Uncharacterized protein n=1 Tax=Roseivirga seohaensis subsp. aquiponti TaxID=1566026 RepID=A0A0L8AMN6_9BACT|nr:hypothetical protein [Roseivirga seohaensis]KOF03511.1 hypothetical protein OB69_06415 [Roseivirga seohaensis subsp. aquiponti]
MIQSEEHHVNRLIEKIKSITDPNVLEEVYRLLAVDFDDSIYLTSDAQKQVVAESQQMIEKGNGISSEKADDEIDQWLKK